MDWETLDWTDSSDPCRLGYEHTGVKGNYFIAPVQGKDNDVITLFLLIVAPNPGHRRSCLSREAQPPPPPPLVARCVP